MLTQWLLPSPLTSPQGSYLYSHMCIPAHSPWLPGYIDVAQTVLVILTMAGHVSGKPSYVLLYIIKHILCLYINKTCTHKYKYLYIERVIEHMENYILVSIFVNDNQIPSVSISSLLMNWPSKVNFR